LSCTKAISVKRIDSQFAKKLIMEQAWELYLYDAEDLSSKYAIDPEVIDSIDDFEAGENGN